jgi:hypothetical protein
MHALWRLLLAGTAEDAHVLVPRNVPSRALW